MTNQLPPLPPLIRTSYNDNEGHLRSSTGTAHSESQLDIASYHQVLEQVHASKLHTWGIAAGLGVTVTASSPTPSFTITPGVGLDALGRHILLTGGVSAETNPAATPYQPQTSTLVSVGNAGLTLTTTAMIPGGSTYTGPWYLTIQWLETFDINTWTNSLNQTAQMLHTPWVRLRPTTALQNDGQQLILGKLTLDGSGNVFSLAPDYRQYVGIQLGNVLLLKPQTASATQLPDSTEAGKIQPLTSVSGLALTVPNKDDEIHMERDDGGNVHKISLGADNVSISGNVGIGTTTPGATVDIQATNSQADGLHIAGGANAEAALQIVSHDAGYEIVFTGAGAANIYQSAPNHPLYINSNTGDMYLGAGDGSQALTIKNTGNVGIGTTNPGSSLTIAANYDGDGIGLIGSRAGIKDAGISFFDEGGRGGSLGFASAPNAWMTNVSVTDMILMSYNGKVLLGSGPATSIPAVAVSGSNVGIGTLSPGATLDVNGNISASSGVTGAGGDNFGVRGNARNVGIYAHNDDVGNDAYLASRCCAGDFYGPVYVHGPTTTVTIEGTLQVDRQFKKPGGQFQIDHPLDPARKYLSHSFVESPDMKNIYDGVVVLDTQGEAEVELPAWFEALNKDFRYQLTCLGSYAPVYIAQEIHNNRFAIAGGQVGMKVSWQVTGIRQDVWANAHRILVEEDKPIEEQGYYLHPELYGESEEKHVRQVRHPEMIKLMEQRKQMKEEN